MKQIRIVSWVFIVVLLVLMAGYIGSQQSGGDASPAPSVITPIAGFNQATHFTLTDHTGGVFNSAEKIPEGDYALIFFGFTHCPVICPTELQKMAIALDLMPTDVQGELHPLFITIDPERDTASHLKSYVTQFHPNIVGLTGDVKNVHSVLDSWKVFYKKVNDPTLTEYTMDHSTYAYVVDHNMRILALFPMKATEDDIAKEIIKIINH